MGERKTPVKIARPVVPMVSHACTKETYGSIPGEALAWAFSREGYEQAIGVVQRALAGGSSGEADAAVKPLKRLVEEMRRECGDGRPPHFSAEVVKTQALAVLQPVCTDELNHRVATFFAMAASQRTSLNECLASRDAGVVFKQVKKSAVGVGRRILNDSVLVRPDGSVWIDVTLAPPILAAAALEMRYGRPAARAAPRPAQRDFLQNLDAVADRPYPEAPPLEHQVVSLESEIANLRRQLRAKDRELALKDQQHRAQLARATQEANVKLEEQQSELWRRAEHQRLRDRHFLQAYVADLARTLALLHPNNLELHALLQQHGAPLWPPPHQPPPQQQQQPFQPIPAPAPGPRHFPPTPSPAPGDFHPRGPRDDHATLREAHLLNALRQHLPEPHLS
mmetsp:Transcript_22892/g.71787  ORF Transcript_22892/g.71787 Transcript_22892/m.71787 type:complete len:395 (-) Transcript_22892:77-1261(-)